jgi:regulatory protein
VDPQAQEERAREYLLRSLGASARTRHQLSEGLARRGFDPDLAERLLDRFTEVGLIDDAELARTLVRTRVAERHLSRRALAVELRRKGIADDDARAALEAIDDDLQEETARAFVASRIRRASSLDPVTRSRRLVGALARKGYSAEVATRVVREALAADAADAAARDEDDLRS